MEATETAEQEKILGSMPKLSFESLTFSDGTKVNLDEDDIVAIVGPNNAGKSATLGELFMGLDGNSRRKIVPEIQIKQTGTVEDLKDFLSENSTYSGDGRTFYGLNYNINIDIISQLWNIKQNWTNFRNLFFTFITTVNRITGSDPANSIQILTDHPRNPIHLLLVDDRVESRLSSYFKRAFGKDLILFRGGGSRLPLMVGTRPSLLKGEDRVSRTYAERLMAEAKPLEKQGDGMRSFST